MNKDLQIFNVTKGQKYRLPVAIAGDERGGFGNNIEAPKTGIAIVLGGKGIILSEQEVVDLLCSPLPAPGLYMGKSSTYWLDLEEQKRNTDLEYTRQCVMNDRLKHKLNSISQACETGECNSALLKKIQEICNR